MTIPVAAPAGTSQPPRPLIVSATKSSNSSGTDPPMSHRSPRCSSHHVEPDAASTGRMAWTASFADGRSGNSTMSTRTAEPPGSRASRWPPEHPDPASHVQGQTLVGAAHLGHRQIHVPSFPMSVTAGAGKMSSAPGLVALATGDRVGQHRIGASSTTAPRTDVHPAPLERALSATPAGLMTSSRSVAGAPGCPIPHTPAAEPAILSLVDRHTEVTGPGDWRRQAQVPRHGCASPLRGARVATGFHARTGCPDGASRRPRRRPS
jgi:hypothetical protein